MSYVNNQATKNNPQDVDPALLPSISIDLDVPHLHVRLPDGTLRPSKGFRQQHARGWGVSAAPVSILKRLGAMARRAYAAFSVVVPVD